MGILSWLFKEKETIYCTGIVYWALVERNVFQANNGYAMWSPVPLQDGDTVYYGNPTQGKGVYAVMRDGEYIYKDDGFNLKNYTVV